MNHRATRQLCILLIVTMLLPLYVSAQDYYTLPEIYQQAQPGWHKTYEAHGRTIMIDLPITIPEVDVFPSLTASLMPYSQKVPMPASGTWERVFDGVYSVDNGREFFTCLSGDFDQLARLGCYDEPSDKGSFEPQDYYTPDIDLMRAYATNNQATPADLVNRLMEVWARYHPDILIDLRLEKVSAGVYFKQFDMTRNQYIGEALPTNREAFLSAEFRQYMQGIPVLSFVDAEIGPKRPLLKANALSRSLSNCGLPGRNEMFSYSLLREEEIIEADLRLCSVTQAIVAYEHFIKSGNIRLIDELRLGYVVKDDSQGQGYMLTPAWVAWGIWVENPKKEAWKQNADETLRESNYRISTEYRPILLDAVNGELLYP